MNRPVHFEIHASEPKQAAAFYRSVFGWQVERVGQADYWLITTAEAGPGINGGMLQRRGPRPSGDAPVSSWVMIVEVEDCAARLDAARDAGATVAVPMDKMPGVGLLAYIRDPDGNVFGMLEPEPASPS